jgi:thiol:disulfide interchange protein DsbD
VKKLLFLILLVLRAGARAAQARRLDRQPARAGEGVPLFARRARGRAVEVRFAIADGYYLYRDRFRSRHGRASRQGRVPAGLSHKDEFFGEQQIYRKEVRIRVPVEAPALRPQGDLARLRRRRRVLHPDGVDVSLRLPRRTWAAAPSIFSSDLEIASLFQEARRWCWRIPRVRAAARVHALRAADDSDPLGHHRRRGRSLSKSRALALSLAYVIGMASPTPIAGVAAAYSGSLLAAALQNAWVLGAFALVFVLLALSMFGLYELQAAGLPAPALDDVQRRLPGGRVASVAGMGALSAVIVSPCVAAPLAGALLYIAQIARRGARRCGALRHGAGHGGTPAGGGRLRGRAAAEIGAVAESRQTDLRVCCCWRSRRGSCRRSFSAARATRNSSGSTASPSSTQSSHAPGKPVMLDFFTPTGACPAKRWNISLSASPASRPSSTACCSCK